MHERKGGFYYDASSDARSRSESTHIVSRDVIDDRPVKVEYSLTGVGQSLEIIIADFVDWKQEYEEYVDSLDDGLDIDSGE